MSKPESWRNTDVEEWGNSILAGDAVDFGAMRRSLDALHRDAAASDLPGGSRYIVLIPYGEKNVMCWYRSADMDEYPAWTGHGEQVPFGYYLVGRYFTPEKPKKAKNGGAA